MLKKVLNRFITSKIKPSRKLVDVTKKMIGGQQVFTLIDEQIAANNTIIDRRGFLRKSCTYSLTALMALNFGCSIKELIGDGDAILSLIYGTKYGATRDTVHWIKKGIGNHVELLDVENFCNLIKLYHQASKFIDGFKLTDKEVSHFIKYDEF